MVSVGLESRDVGSLRCASGSVVCAPFRYLLGHCIFDDLNRESAGPLSVLVPYSHMQKLGFNDVCIEICQLQYVMPSPP